MENKLLLFKGYIPGFVFNDDVDKIKKKAGLIHILAYLCLFIFQIPFFAINIYKIKYEDLKNETFDFKR